MSQLVLSRVKPAHKFMWAVSTYLDLISSDGELVAGSGLMRLYALNSGLASLSDADIEGVAAKAEKLGFYTDRSGLISRSIRSNLLIYAQELYRVIAKRVSHIADGSVRNPDYHRAWRGGETKPVFYAPPAYFLKRVLQALDRNSKGPTAAGSPATLADVASEGVLLFTQMKPTGGDMTGSETSWGALLNTVEGLVAFLQNENMVSNSAGINYRQTTRPAVKILWVIAKLLHGDLALRPQPHDINLTDINLELSFTDGTLASIPFPLANTAKVFQDNDVNGVSLKGRAYLSAVSAAAFYRGELDDEN